MAAEWHKKSSKAKPDSFLFDKTFYLVWISDRSAETFLVSEPITSETNSFSY